MSLSSTLRPNLGFHFEYSTTLNLNIPNAECAAYLLFTLPASVFVDKYELRQRGLRFTLHGYTDLELPLAAVDPIPSILEIDVPSSRSGADKTSVSVTFPLHARYPPPSASSYSTVQVSKPQVFWACPLNGGSPAQDAAFSHVPSPYVPSLDLNFWNITFLDLPEKFHEIHVPTGIPAHVQFVEFGTAFTIFIAFLLIARTIFTTARRLYQTDKYHKKRE